MSSVALPAVGSGPAVRSEADLWSAAARSDRDAFNELYLRHSQTSWHLAMAVSPDPAQAQEAVADGFAQVLRGVRRRRSTADQPFRPALLAAIYRSALDRSRQAPAPTAHPEASADTRDPADAPTATLAAFRSLPERWRAALWLAEVEHVSVPALSAVLAVSDPVATQLADRGRQGLLARLAQAGVPVPDHLDEVLRPLATGLPEELGAVSAKRWKSSVAADAAGRLTPATDWLAERAPRPLWIACGGLVALSVVGLGVLTVSSPPTPTGPAAAISAPPIGGNAPVNPAGTNGGGHVGVLVPPSGGGGSFFTGAATMGSRTVGSPSSSGALAAAVASGPVSPTVPSGPATPAATGPATPPPPVGPPTNTSGPGTQPGTNPGSQPGNNAGTNPGSQPGTNPGSNPPPANNVVNVPGVTNVAVPPAGGVQATIGAPSAPKAQLIVSPSCTGVELLDVATASCVVPPGSGGATVPSSLSNLLGNLGLK